MKKKLANLLFMVTVALQATAQITILSMDDVKKSEPIDELVFRAQYELKMVEDTTKTDCQPNSETMMLEVGKKCSQFYSYTTYLRDSTLIADYANKVSQDILQQHAKAYGNGRITYRIYKNYPTGKVTTLDRLRRMLTQPIAILSIPFPVSNGREMIFCSLPPLLSGGVICQSNLIAVFVSPHSFVSVINLLPVGKCPY